MVCRRPPRECLGERVELRESDPREVVPLRLEEECVASVAFALSTTSPLACFRDDTLLFLCVSFSISFPCPYSDLFRCCQTPAPPARSGRPTGTTTTLLLPLQGIKRHQGMGGRVYLQLTGLLLKKLHSPLWWAPALSSHDKRALWATLTLAFHGFIRASELTSPTLTA